MDINLNYVKYNKHNEQKSASKNNKKIANCGVPVIKFFYNNKDRK